MQDNSDNADEAIQSANRRAFLGRAAKIALAAPAVAVLLDAPKAMAINCYVGNNDPKCKTPT